MNYLGDYAEDATLHFKWNTVATDGASVTRATDGALWVYKDDATGTEVQTGITDTEDFDGLTGVHHCKIVLTDAFYATAADYTVVLKGAVLDGKTVNAVLATFSIKNRFMRGTDGANTTVPDNTKVAFIKNVLEGDAYIDKVPTPWQLVVKIKGTETELIRKDLKDILDANIAAITTPIAKHEEPA